MTRSFKGIWIPKEIWLDENLGWSEKLLLVEIDSLDNDDGCWATNEYFAEFFKLSKDRISKMISSLRNREYLTVEIVYKPGTKLIEKRIVKITDRYRRKHLEGIGENNDTPIGENTEENNTVFNNTVLLKKEPKEENQNFEAEEPLKDPQKEKEKSCAKKEKENIPDLATFMQYAREIYQNKLKRNFTPYEFSVESKYESWIKNGWKDGNGKKITCWKNKLKNTIPHLKAIYNGTTNKGFTGTETGLKQPKRR